jgi:hypothetical protein
MLTRAFLYCRRLESITSVHIRCWKCGLCAAVIQRENTKAYYSTCVAVADFVLDTLFFTEVLPVECSAAD